MQMLNGYELDGERGRVCVRMCVYERGRERVHMAQDPPNNGWSDAL